MYEIAIIVIMAAVVGVLVFGFSMVPDDDKLKRATMNTFIVLLGLLIFWLEGASSGKLGNPGNLSKDTYYKFLSTTPLPLPLKATTVVVLEYPNGNVRVFEFETVPAFTNRGIFQ